MISLRFQGKSFNITVIQAYASTTNAKEAKIKQFYVEEKNRMGKTRDLFKKIRDTKGTFYANMGLIQDRNGMDLTEAEDIK